MANSGKTDNPNTVTLNGIPASPGIAIGRVFLYRQKMAEASQPSEAANKANELGDLKRALVLTRAQLESILAKATREVGESEASIFQAHILMLDDPSLLREINNSIENGRSVEESVAMAVEKYASAIESLSDETLKARAADVRDVGARILRNLKEEETFSLSDLVEQVIVVASNLTPSDTIELDKEKVLGFATEAGARAGAASHVAIFARSLGIPAVIGLRGVTTIAKDLDMIILDGTEGIAVLRPTKELLEEYLGRLNRTSIKTGHVSEENPEPGKT
jgi:phosphotransferase system enzyme I (PtsI)